MKIAVVLIGLILLAGAASGSGAQAVPTATPIPPGSSAWTPAVQNFDGVDMVLVPAGCFTMGSTAEEIEAVFQACEARLGVLACERAWFERESPAREVCFDEPFWIDRTEVTNAQFAQSGLSTQFSPNWSDANRPRENVTWFEARSYCQNRGARLPSEAEWEYAARGPDRRVYPWGSEFVETNLIYSPHGQTADVGSTPGGVSWIGALDMSGNVSEWVNSVYMLYPYEDSREGETYANAAHAIRGGSWINGPLTSRAAYREWDDPTLAANILGFRCARSFSETTTASTATPVPSGVPFFSVRARNDYWTPVIQDFDGVEMALVPGGCLMLGSGGMFAEMAYQQCVADFGAAACSLNDFDDEKPANQVCFERPFWIDRTEVTNAQFAAFQGAAALESRWPDERLPREAITWVEARAFCESRGARLPTEAEWEFAARGPEGKVYAWGNTFDGTRLNFCDANCGQQPPLTTLADDGYSDPAPVGSYPNAVSWVGALDMSGNVSEWTSTIYRAYPYSARDGREEGGDPSSPRVFRGGSWQDSTTGTRATDRGQELPTFQADTLGVRCVRDY